MIKNITIKHWLGAIFCILALNSSLTAQKSAINRDLLESIRPQSDYVIYLVWGSVPALYAAMHMQTHSKPSLLWVQRSDHFDYTHLPKHVELVEDLYLRTGSLEQRIDRLIAENSDATYTIYLTDTMAGFGVLNYFIGAGLSLERLTIEFLSDGSATTNLYYQHYANKSNGLKLFQDDLSRTRGWLREAGQDRDSVSMWNYKYLYAFSRLLNARIWLTHSKNVFPQESMVTLQLNFFELPFEQLYSLLTAAQKRNFELLLNFDRKKFDPIINRKGDKRQSVVVIGGWSTDDAGNRWVSEHFVDDITKLVEHLGDGYRYFFKGHPELPNGNAFEQAAMAALGFESLPNTRFPFELLLIVYPNLKVGGYSSSVFNSASANQLCFIFGQLTAQPALALYQMRTWPYVIHINADR